MASSYSASEGELVDAISKYARNQLLQHDASHDWDHIQRVTSLALRIADRDTSRAAVDRLVVHLAAYLHDVADHKYVTSAEQRQDVLTAAGSAMEARGLEPQRAGRVLEIVRHVSFSQGGDLSAVSVAVQHELAIARDADRLDAIGALGIARCFAYGGAKGRPLYDRDSLKLDAHTDAMPRGAVDASCLAHFFSKLLRVRDTIVTPYARVLAEERHVVLVAFVKQLQSEVAGSSA